MMLSKLSNRRCDLIVRSQATVSGIKKQQFTKDTKQRTTTLRVQIVPGAHPFFGLPNRKHQKSHNDTLNLELTDVYIQQITAHKR